jgi:hypothetical protein
MWTGTMDTDRAVAIPAEDAKAIGVVVCLQPPRHVRVFHVPAMLRSPTADVVKREKFYDALTAAGAVWWVATVMAQGRHATANLMRLLLRTIALKILFFPFALVLGRAWLAQRRTIASRVPNEVLTTTGTVTHGTVERVRSSARTHL